MSGIAVAGNLLVDKIKMIENYPKQGMLVNILDMKTCVGGCVPNTIIDLAKIDSTTPLYAIGKVGDDNEGEYIKGRIKENGVDVSQIQKCGLQTSFTDVMTVISSGERTFFHNIGANADFSISDIEVDKLECDIFHIGYILLLNKMDEEDEKYGTKMARLLYNIQKKGIKTSIDLVSEKSDRFKKVVTPALRYCNYLIINEIEAGQIVDMKPRTEDGIIILENIKHICKKIIKLGVKEKVIIHFPEGAVVMNSDENYMMLSSLDLPKGYIKGSVGAGDAFCAGALYSIYNNFDDKKMLRFASASATANLSSEDSVSGMRDAELIWQLEKQFKRK